VDEMKEEKIKFNEMELELNREKEYVPNPTSMMIVKNNNYYNFKKNITKQQEDNGETETNNEIEFDLWPDINKTYVKGDQVTENTFTNDNTNQDLSNYRY